MYGRLMIEPVVQVDPNADLQAGVTALKKITETAEIVRWIELPAAVLLFLLLPGDPESGAVYVLDRKTGTWYAVDFEDESLQIGEGVGHKAFWHISDLLSESHITLKNMAQKRKARQ